jgi:hypothetical protein
MGASATRFRRRDDGSLPQWAPRIPDAKTSPTLVSAPVTRALRGWRWPALILAVLALLTAACGDSADDNASTSNGGKFACLGFLATVTQGPDSGRFWSGDLVLEADRTGAFTGRLVAAGSADPQTLEIHSGAGTICTAVGQRNGAMVSWTLQCDQDRLFGTGQVTPVGDHQELRGILQGPADNDFGVYHGRNYPPFIRIISGTQR